ncbi:hypothetical protein BDV95DRAFT_610666 [Massariosphaeria phaeospora]|uniref:Uncharacterized protein n=1 Tax=Massariosphaeria phaeospora TaxID=100035 RepID=A0A7C8MEX4_9PLEO|nr:hypothetical protein BDV95DRAFT_610666 [Massariosphaeria phaeospora]
MRLKSSRFSARDSSKWKVGLGSEINAREPDYPRKAFNFAMRVFASHFIGILIPTLISFDPSVSAQFTPVFRADNEKIRIQLDQDLSNTVIEWFKDGEACPVKAARGLDISKREEAVETCLVDTAKALITHRYFVQSLVQLYRESPVPGIPATMENLPGYEDKTQQEAFYRLLGDAANLFSMHISDLAAVEIPWLTMAVLGVAIDRAWNHPKSYENFATGRRGQMRLSCPAKEKIPCTVELCKGQSTGVCAAFLTPCPCTQQECTKPPEEDNNKLLFCNQCGGMDKSTGLCSGAQENGNRYRNCPCDNTEPPEPLTWLFDPEGWHNAINTVQDILKGPGFPENPEKLTCYKLDEERMKSIDNWRFVDQKALDDAIGTFCRERFQGIDNPSEGVYKQHFFEGQWNDMILGIDYASGTKITVDDCLEKMLLPSKNCDYDASKENNKNQYGWKWGGEYWDGENKFWLAPQRPRVPPGERAPDSPSECYVWSKFSDKGDKGKSGALLDKKTILQCIHQFSRQGWETTYTAPEVGGETKWDKSCGSLVDFSVQHDSGYHSADDCFGALQPCLAWNLVHNNAIVQTATHKSSPAVKCWVGFNDYSPA